MVKSTKAEPAEFLSITPTAQLGDNECAVAAIATLTSVPYAEVLTACGPLHGDGLTQAAIVAALRRLGYTCRAKRRIDWEHDCGLLTTIFPQSQHVCVLWNGVLFDPDEGRLWEDAEAFLSVEQVRASVLTVLWRR